MQDAALRRIVALVIAALLSVAGATSVVATVASGEAQATPSYDDYGWDETG